MNRYEKATARRQPMLDYIRTHPGASGPTIAASVPSVQRNNISKILSRMVEHGEIGVTGETITKTGHVCRTYVALRAECIPADDIVARMTEKMHEACGRKDYVSRARKERAEESTKKSGYIAPGHYRNYAGSLSSPNSGGQGGVYTPRMQSRIMG